MGAVLTFMLLTGCGVLYTNIKTPLPSLSINTNAASQSKVGKATCLSYVWAVALGDCSTEAAMKNGDISKVHHVDYKEKSYFFSIYSEYTVVVYGE